MSSVLAAATGRGSGAVIGDAWRGLVLGLDTALAGGVTVRGGLDADGAFRTGFSPRSLVFAVGETGENAGAACGGLWGLFGVAGGGGWDLRGG